MTFVIRMGRSGVRSFTESLEQREFPHTDVQVQGTDDNEDVTG
jgi:hypothetical protein